MKISAYCNELEKDLTPVEVWHLIHGQNRINQELTFKCSDPACGARMVLRNCSRIYEPNLTTFRLYPRDEHIKGCTFVKAVKIKRRQDQKDKFNEVEKKNYKYGPF